MKSLNNNKQLIVLQITYQSKYSTKVGQFWINEM